MIISAFQAKDLLNFQKRLLLGLNNGRGFEGLAEEVGRETDCPVIITNSLQRVVATWNVPYAVSQGNALTVEPTENKFDSSRIFFEGQTWEATCFPVRGQENILHGYLFLLDVKDDRALVLGETAAEFLSLEFLRLQSVHDAEQKHRDSFIFDLLYSNFDTEDTIVTWGELWGWNLKGVHAVAVFSLEGYEDCSRGKNTMKSLFRIGEEACRISGLSEMVMQKREQLIIIISLAENKKKANRNVIRNLVDNFLKITAVHLPEAKIKLGIGRRYDSPTEIFRSYQEAKVALELGKLIEPKEGMPFFANLGVARLLFNHDWQALKEFYGETLGDLKDTELMETLEVYAKQGYDLKSTAELLFLHPNSLRYRLKKIEEILERNLDEFETKIDVSVAMKIKALLRLGAKVGS